MSDEQTTLFRDNAEYDAFVGKFKPKESHRMNSDDCYTPPLVFQAIQDWACAECGIDPERIVRPFYPGGDYEHEDYPEGCTVLDNPPFSILKEIVGFYRRRGIHFFLYGPALLLGRDWADGLTVITPGVSIEYANGAVVNTGFVTDLGGEVVARTAPELGMKIRVALANTYGKEPAAGTRKTAYPPEFLTCAMLETYSRGGHTFPSCADRHSASAPWTPRKQRGAAPSAADGCWARPRLRRKPRLRNAGCRNGS